MTPITSTVEINRTAGDVFSYLTDPARFAEWQANVVSGRMEEGPPGIGSKCVTTRKIGGAERTTTQVVSQFDPPHKWSVKGIDGPIRADVTATVEPVRGGAASQVTVELDFHGHGVGKLIAPLVMAQARKEVPRSCQRLKYQLERP